MKLSKYITILLLTALSTIGLAQKRSDIIRFSELKTNYSVATIKVGNDGTKFIKVSAFGKKDDAAVLNAKANAVHAVLFRGLPGGPDSNATPALCTDPNCQVKHKAYFDNFFANGEHLQYINQITDGVPSGADRIKVKGGYVVKLSIQVMFDNLKRKLEADGIITAISDRKIGKKPIIMVVPSDAWCTRNGYVQEFNNNGVIQKVSDYATAMNQNSEINALVSKMGDIMAAEKYPIQSLKHELKRLQSEEAELSLWAGNETGAGIAETPQEYIRRTAKADIILEIDFEKKVGAFGRQQVTFNLTALDAYTSKIISGNPGIGSISTSPVQLLLEEAVLSFKDNFLTALDRFFETQEKEGREIIVSFRRANSSPIDFETEFNYNGQSAELADIIGVWFEENSVNGNFSEQDRSTNSLRYNQVRMPLFGKSLSGKEVAVDATKFVRPLTNMLKGEPYNTTVKIYQKGLGEVWLILGEK